MHDNEWNFHEYKLATTILQASCSTFFSVLAPWALWVLTTIIPVGFKNNEASAVSKLDHHRSLNLHRLTGGSRDIKMQIGGKVHFHYWLTLIQATYLLLQRTFPVELIEMKLMYIVAGVTHFIDSRRFARCFTTTTIIIALSIFCSRKCFCTVTCFAP